MTYRGSRSRLDLEGSGRYNGDATGRRRHPARPLACAILRADDLTNSGIQLESTCRQRL